MGEVIGASAEQGRIVDHVQTAYDLSIARGGEVAEAAFFRLGPGVTAIGNAKEMLDAAKKAESLAWATVAGIDYDADGLIASTRDEMWNALGRPKQSPHMDAVFPEGIGTYTAGDPLGQPLLMGVLRTRILAGEASQWTEVKRNAWASAIEAKREAYEVAVNAYRPAGAALVVAEAGYRAAVRGAHTRLRNYKRDLKNLGLTEAQIHEIIPDASAGKKGSGGGNGEQ
ncbi:hypothetical protein [Polyangium sp. 6x1]|uniref:hypothetical protein n=1 Tax=Polyangium sp. 6x1 TaxID=3042689 RepID=UPI0024824062|nr:hypothetical protein [Polyangium sp. 6x1]MDI1451654.1 hypothetical protein [Polyangium sp. 6x1]